jgi:hypothetical protein
MALECLKEPEILKASEDEQLRFDYNDGKTEYVPAKEAQSAFYEYVDLIQEFKDWDAGNFTMSRDEYKRLPAPYIDARRIYNSFFMRKDNGRPN